MTYYADKMKEHDIIIVQEITDGSGEAFQKLCDLMEGYSCVVSERKGSTNYKEQYSIIYKSARLLASDDIESIFSPTTKLIFERPPYYTLFKAGNWKFALITLHTHPEKVTEELIQLQGIISFLTSPGQEWEGYDVLIMGNLNADCSYFDNNKEVVFDIWTWIIPDDEDTTVEDTSCAYDRILLNDLAVNNFLRYGVMRDVNSSQSDHYLVWAKFKTIEG